MRRWGIALMTLSLAVLMVGAEKAGAGPRFLGVNAESGGDGGPYVNLIVREVRVAPIVAHVGDVVRIEMAVENRGDNANDTVPAEIRANGKVVAGRLFTYGFGGEPGKVYRQTFLWDTKGASPGEYRIRGEVFLWYDASEFDNFLDVKEPLVLLPVGAALPPGKEDGGAAVAVDPRWSAKRTGEAPSPGPTGGY
ncbi:MAG TPA: hypothetical protein VJ386_10580 [Candidatus Deferrimicrobiaceae bacterium]|nr:hypothetical protein [Candidatus Deferrimicrobiaceae bacterium]